ncbi:MAG: NAD(P)H-quinone dehydrogenase [Propionibacteriaceae bacterium]
MTRLAIIGGGPGGYEAALVAAQLGGEVVLIEQRGIGGSAVLTDCVTSKALIATSTVMNALENASELGLSMKNGEALAAHIQVDLAAVNRRVLALAADQSVDIRAKLIAAGVNIIDGRGRFISQQTVAVTSNNGSVEIIEFDVALVATGCHPRVLTAAQPDGEKILTWEQLWNLTELPKQLIVVGSGVTGAEFASAYDALGVDVVLVSSRDKVLPGEDPDAAEVLHQVFERRGMEVMSRARAVAAHRTDDGVIVTLEDGRIVSGSHCLMAVGSIPNTEGLGLREIGVELTESGHVAVDGVSRTSVRTIYAAGDCTGVFALASVAAMQGRIAMWHAFGDAVAPLDLTTVSANVFTNPEIATVGVTQRQIDQGEVRAITQMLPLSSNARAKMQGFNDGFVKIFCRPATGNIIGGVVVSPHASELIHALSVAVKERVTVDNFSTDFTVYPSLSGSLAEAARQLHGHSEHSADR